MTDVKIISDTGVSETAGNNVGMSVWFVLAAENYDEQVLMNLLGSSAWTISAQLYYRREDGEDYVSPPGDVVIHVECAT